LTNIEEEDKDDKVVSASGSQIGTQTSAMLGAGASTSNFFGKLVERWRALDVDEGDDVGIATGASSAGRNGNLSVGSIPLEAQRSFPQQQPSPGGDQGPSLRQRQSIDPTDPRIHRFSQQLRDGPPPSQTPIPSDSTAVESTEEAEQSHSGDSNEGHKR